MKYASIFLISFLSLNVGVAQNAEIIKVAKLLEMMNGPSEDIRVINFWATWCGPCVKELPLFEKLASSRPEIKVTLVSLDLDVDPNADKVYKFIAKRGLKSHVVLLDERDPNSWIDKIEKNWSGTLPATIVINQKTGQRKFIEKELHEGDLEKLISEVQ